MLVFFFFLLQENFESVSWNTFLAISTQFSFCNADFIYMYIRLFCIDSPIREAVLILLHSFFFLFFS